MPITAAETQSLQRTVRQVCRGEQMPELVERLSDMARDEIKEELKNYDACVTGESAILRDRLLRLHLILLGFDPQWGTETDGRKPDLSTIRQSAVTEKKSAGKTSTVAVTTTTSAATTVGAAAPTVSVVDTPIPENMLLDFNGSEVERERVFMQRMRERGWTPPPTLYTGIREKEQTRFSTIEEKSERSHSSRAKSGVSAEEFAELSKQIGNLQRTVAALSLAKSCAGKSERGNSLGNRRENNAARESSRSESSDTGESERSDRRRRRLDRTNRAYRERLSAGALARLERFAKLLQNRKLQFKSGDRAKAQAFLQRVREFRASVPMSSSEFLETITHAFIDDADVWFMANKPEFLTYEDFERGGLRICISGAYDEDDVLDELMHRVQGESETISQYLTFVRMQLRQCDEPPAGKKLARIIWRNLRPSYRRAMLDTCPSSMKGIEQAGLRYERGRELDEQSQLGETTLTEHHIDVQGAEPIKHRPRRMSPKTLEIAYKEIDKMLADGVIERSASAWSSAPVIVKKADGSDRFCIDYRDLNKVTKKDAYPVPNIDHILDKLRRARYITTIDLKSAYFQIRMEEASKKIYSLRGCQGRDFISLCGCRLGFAMRRLRCND
ncbi:unnamed protein product [Trichogramma brassicae]|uniref:Reverse transcriptase domain-containing protein n=1 Tax=Trichogramma brassicae TaxID=86971 RepID=A0A6H5IRM0_9HYME|nr:unnamed protein product [Trichogramma brassicae]